MRQTIVRALVTLLVGGLVGCGATRPVKYYAIEPPTSSVHSANPYAASILVGHIAAPHLYRDDRLVYQTGPVQMGAYEYHRWVEPPTDMIEDMLVHTLRASGQYRSVSRRSSNSRGDYILRGRLSALEEVDIPAIAARFSIELELFQPKTGATVWTQEYSHDEPVGTKTVPAIVEALQRNVQAGMQQLSAGLAQYLAAHPPQ
jgi:cholesterol transport system auxiliary component